MNNLIKWISFSLFFLSLIMNSQPSHARELRSNLSSVQVKQKIDQGLLLKLSSLEKFNNEDLFQLVKGFVFNWLKKRDTFEIEVKQFLGQSENRELSKSLLKLAIYDLYVNDTINKKNKRFIEQLDIPDERISFYSVLFFSMNRLSDWIRFGRSGKSLNHLTLLHYGELQDLIEAGSLEAKKTKTIMDIRARMNLLELEKNLTVEEMQPLKIKRRRVVYKRQQLGLDLGLLNKKEREGDVTLDEDWEAFIESIQEMTGSERETPYFLRNDLKLSIRKATQEIEKIDTSLDPLKKKAEDLSKQFADLQAQEVGFFILDDDLALRATKQGTVMLRELDIALSNLNLIFHRMLKSAEIKIREILLGRGGKFFLSDSALDFLKTQLIQVYFKNRLKPEDIRELEQVFIDFIIALRNSNLNRKLDINVSVEDMIALPYINLYYELDGEISMEEVIASHLEITRKLRGFQSSVVAELENLSRKGWPDISNNFSISEVNHEILITQINRIYLKNNKDETFIRSILEALTEYVVEFRKYNYDYLPTIRLSKEEVLSTKYSVMQAVSNNISGKPSAVIKLYGSVKEYLVRNKISDETSEVLTELVTDAALIWSWNKNRTEVFLNEVKEYDDILKEISSEHGSFRDRVVIAFLLAEIDVLLGLGNKQALIDSFIESINQLKPFSHILEDQYRLGLFAAIHLQFKFFILKQELFTDIFSSSNHLSHLMNIGDQMQAATFELSPLGALSNLGVQWYGMDFDSLAGLKNLLNEDEVAHTQAYRLSA